MATHAVRLLLGCEDTVQGANYLAGRKRLPGDLFDQHEGDDEAARMRRKRSGDQDDASTYDVDAPGALSPSGVDEQIAELIR